MYKFTVDAASQSVYPNLNISRKQSEITFNCTLNNLIINFIIYTSIMENDPRIIRSKENPGFKHNPILSMQEQEQIISQGAEGRIFLSELWGTPCIVKERFKKEYRVPALDESLTK